MRAIVLTVAVAQLGQAQKPPAVRQLRALERVTPDSLAFKSVSVALAMPGGRVMVNDVAGRRVVLLDSSLTRTTILADTTSATAEAYGASWATLIRYRGDSALFMVPSTLSMFVFGPTGSVVRVVSMPRPNDAQNLALHSLSGMPGIDAHGRLVYWGSGAGANSTLLWTHTTPWLQNGKPSEAARAPMSRGGGWVSPTTQRSDSGAIARVDFTTRVMDTVALIRVQSFRRTIKVDDAGFAKSIEVIGDPLPLMDQWVVLRDGTIAIARGRDYHVDWIDASGHMTSTPKMPFDWQRIDDARKVAIIDSAVAAYHSFPPPDTGRFARSGRGGLRPPSEIYVPNIAGRISPNEVADYYPAFGARSLTSDWEGNVWIQTSVVVDKRPVYDVVNRRGEIIDRLQLPAFRTIAGFGPGVIYMAVKDNAATVHLERARLR